MPHAVHAGWGSGGPLVLRDGRFKESMRRRLHRDLHCGLVGARRRRQRPDERGGV